MAIPVSGAASAPAVQQIPRQAPRSRDIDPALGNLVARATKNAKDAGEPRFSGDDTAALTSSLENALGNADSLALKAEIGPALKALKAKGATTFDTLGTFIPFSSKRANLADTVKTLEAHVAKRGEALDRASTAMSTFQTKGLSKMLASMATDAVTNAAMENAPKWLARDAGAIFDEAMRIIQHDRPDQLDAARSAIGLLRTHADRVESDQEYALGKMKRAPAEKAISALERALDERLGRAGESTERPRGWAPR